MADTATKNVGRATRRVDGRLKVTGQAKYAAEYEAPDLLHGYLVLSTIASGTIVSIEMDAARQSAGVVDIFTHDTRQGVSWWDRDWMDETASPGHPFRPLHSERVLYDGQPIAMVVAESFEAARDAAALIEVTYDIDAHKSELEALRGERYEPPQKRDGIPPPPKPRGDAEAALAGSAHRVKQQYSLAPEYHNPMEMFASTVVYQDDHHLTIYDKTQGSQNSQAYVAHIFGLRPENVRVVNAYVGGAFGAGLRPRHQLFLAVMASLKLKRSVRLELARREMFYLSYRPTMEQTVALGADVDGKLQAVIHDAVSVTSMFEDYQEVVVNWSGLSYKCDNTALTYGLVQVNTNTPGDMRAPGATSGVFALETAMDELSYEIGIDPIELRVRNYGTRDEDNDKEFTSKNLHACYREGAERFGWADRNPEPRSMKEGRELVGYGMAAGVWDTKVNDTQAMVRLDRAGKLEVLTASSDIGTGTYTILAQIAADCFALSMDDVTVRIGDSSLPTAPVEGGSWGAASSGLAVQLACEAIQARLIVLASKHGHKVFKNIAPIEVDFSGNGLALKRDPSEQVDVPELLAAAGLDQIEEIGKASADAAVAKKYITYTHGAVFVEVRVDEQLGVVRVKRVVSAIGAGRILNPKTARSQILGGVVMGIGMALHEEGMFDHTTGRLMNPNLAEYHMPANADIDDIEVIFVDEQDELVNPLGVKGLGEIGIVGTAAAVGNAIFHATGKRVRDLPITIDKLLV